MTRRTSLQNAIGPLVLVIALTIVAAACESAGPTAPPTAPISTLPALPTAAVSPTVPSPAATLAPAATAPARIPQPLPPEGLKLAPEGDRIDLALPAFSNPTRITNPLFPVSRQASVLMLGHVGGKPFRTEVTLLPYTRILEWQGMRVETVVSQYDAYLDGRITELAYDYYAQADDGSVWYFGEDVFDFVDGVIVTTEGTWLAGRDAPAAMIMPGRPRVGDVYRPENAPGFVFEEVTVREIGKTLDGPLGPIAGGLLAHELHADGATEDKVFAPGYGEFLTGGDGDLEALALAVPTDAISGPVPAELRVMSGGALRIFDLAGTRGWSRAADEVAGIRAAWATVQAGQVPKPITPLLGQAIKRLDNSVSTRNAASARNAAIQVARLAYDLQLRHRPQPDVDLARFNLWAAQVLVDVAAGDTAGVKADVFALDYTRDRFVHVLDAPVARRLNALLGELQSAVVDDDLETSGVEAAELRAVIKNLLPAG